ncbi:MAG: beta-ketoacyl synthase N-terminal-like domain-containing protein [Verrucomicrobia bacterium]|nr:beta-ketoacyl synthase N-terminal-like domain-containing protein [Verrucomicrobiota bacterium]
MKDQPLSILGVGCVTALGREWETVWQKICAGVPPEPESLPCPGSLPVAVYKTALPGVPDAISARLRRSGPISYLACAAAADAVLQAGPLPCGRTALVFAASDGAVSYTRRFYEEVVGRGAGSPLLFPETVYNAPASHVAAMLGLDGTVLTLVNDATAGMDALSTAADLISSGDADRCLVVAAEELDWISCDGYRRWKLAASGSGDGAVLAEGAVALVLGPPSASCVQISRIHPGRTLLRHRAAGQTIRQVLAELADGATPDLAVLSSTGSRTGIVEESLVRECFPRARLLFPKRVAGNAFAASTLLQCLCAWQELQCGGQAIVPVLGSSGQVGGAFLKGPEI